MRNRSLPLVVHLSVLFGLLMIATAGILSWIGYQRTIELIETNGEEIAARSADQIRDEIDRIFAPVELGIALVGEHQVNRDTGLRERLAEEEALRKGGKCETIRIGC